MNEASIEFAADPCSSVKRGAMVRAARALLSAVTRLLILADMVDVFMLLQTGHSVSQLVMHLTFTGTVVHTRFWDRFDFFSLFWIFFIRLLAQTEYIFSGAERKKMPYGCVWKQINK